MPNNLTQNLLRVGHDPHHVIYDDPDAFTVNERFERVNGAFTVNVTTEHIALYHYVLKSMVRN